MPDPSPIAALEHAIATATDLAKVRAEVLAAMDADRITSVQARQLLAAIHGRKGKAPRGDAWDG